MTRKKHLETYYDLLRKREVQGPDMDDISFHALNEEIEDEKMAYLKSLPIIKISRCPFTNELVSYRMDTIGFGPFWMYNNPMRDEVLGPDTFFALDGSMKAEHVETKERLNLGPDKPFVIKALMEDPFIKAVLSEIEIAGNRTWLITYFSFPTAQIDRPNLYGSDRFFVKMTLGEIAYGSDYTEEDYDFDVKTWIDRGKLLWIKKFDPDMKLQTTSRACPYLDIEGNGKIQRRRGHE